jgi:hypothetical protein
MRPTSRLSLHLGFVGLSLVLGCDPTAVAKPSVLTPQDLQNAQSASVLRAGALSQFTFAMSQQVLFSGVLVDEFAADPSAASQFTEDRRVLNPNSTDYPYGRLSTARINSINAIAALKRYDASPAWPIGELYALNATMEVAFAENMCSGVPLAVMVNGLPTHGPSLTRSQLIVDALHDLDSASAYTSGSDSIASLVLTLRGRALLDSGDFVAAAAAVSSVPLSFVYPLVYNTAVQINDIWSLIGSNAELTVSNREGINGLPFASAQDPRVLVVPVTAFGRSVIEPAIYDSGGASIALARGVEAQLISAEAALQGGQVATWAGILNTLRANAIVPAMTPLPADSTLTASAATQIAVMFRERAFWLFATGHRHGDLRRLVRQYGLPVEAVFPTGLYEGGPLTYGTAVVFQPVGESYNPYYSGCLNDGA